MLIYYIQVYNGTLTIEWWLALATNLNLFTCGKKYTPQGKTNKTVGYDIKYARNYVFLQITWLSVECMYFCS